MNECGCLNAEDATESLTQLGRKQLLINGEWRDAAGGETMPVVNPATEEVIAEVAAGGRARTWTRPSRRRARR